MGSRDGNTTGPPTAPANLHTCPGTVAAGRALFTPRWHPWTASYPLGPRGPPTAQAQPYSGSHPLFSLHQRYEASSCCPLPGQSSKTCRVRTVTRETDGQMAETWKLCSRGYAGFPTKPRLRWSRELVLQRVTCLLLASSHRAHRWSSICESWHPWTWSQTTFSWQATRGLAVSRQEAGHSGLNTDLHS